MNYKEALDKLEKLRELIERYMSPQDISTHDKDVLSQQISESYGEVEDIIEHFGGRHEVKIPPLRGGMQPETFPNFIEAGFLSGFGVHAYQGHRELLKIIGKVKRMASDPSLLPRDETSIDALIRTLRCFRECCQYVQDPPTSERAVQDIVWIMLRSQFDRIDRDDTLPKVGAKAYKPDFGIPELGILVEVKYIDEKTKVPQIQEEIFADIPGYLADPARYQGIVVIVYDKAQKLRDARKFIEDLRNVEGIIDVLVIPGIG